MRSIWKRLDDNMEAADAALRPLIRFVHREMVLLAVLIVISVGAFGATRLAAQKVQTLRLRDAAAWQAIGLRELEAGRTADAVAALRRAATKAPANDSYQLALAHALAADGHHAQARQVLLRVRERQPEDPTVDLALARLEAAGGDPATAIRYYQHALAALWNDTQNAIRPRVRLELIELLLGNGQRSRALSELLVVSPTLADDAATRTKLGRMFLQVGDSARAADQFAMALRSDPQHAEALGGAAEAAFNQGQYARARQLLARIPRPARERVVELRTIVDLVLTRDPLASRLPAAERRNRLLANVEHVAARSAACGGATAASTLQHDIETLRGSLTRTKSIGRDVAEEGMDLIARAEEAIGGVCGPPAPLDRALVLIARRYELRTP